MKVKHLLATGGVAAILALSGASVASATPGFQDCDDFSTPVKIVGGYDPEHLDIDGDGIGCEDNPGEPMAYDLYANLKGDDEPSATPSTTAPEELAKTGLGPDEHPIRWLAVAALSTIVGVGLVFASWRRNPVR